MTRARLASTQYWLWAMLAARFGKELRLRRSSVARMYEVNRHDFDASPSYDCKQDHVAFGAQVFSYVQQKLAEAGYERKEFDDWVKVLSDKGRTYECRISVRYTAELYGVPQDTVSLSLYMHELRSTLAKIAA